MNFLDKSIEEYCVSHSSAPSPVCQEIYDYTVKKVPMAVMITGPYEAAFLGFLVGLTGAKRVLEIGTFTGYSALAMAERLPEGGEVITIDINQDTSTLAKSFWKKSPVGNRIKPLLGDALTLLKEIKSPVDFAFIDADKARYPEYVQATLPLLSPLGMIAVDNTLWSGRVLEEKTDDPDTLGVQKLNNWVRDNQALQKVLVPIRDGILLIGKT